MLTYPMYNVWPIDVNDLYLIAFVLAAFRSRMRDTAEQPMAPEKEQPPEDDEHGQPEAEDDKFLGRPSQARPGSHQRCYG